MRRCAIVQAGGYDEQYFMYGQMTDLGYRLRKLGYDFRVNCDAIAYHAGRGSSGGKLSGFSLYYKVRNWCIFQRKHFGALHMPYTLLWTLGISLMYGIRVTFQGEPHLIRDILRGVRDGLTQNCGAASISGDQRVGELTQ
jgi:GT2 family glycosyltransferase